MKKAPRFAALFFWFVFAVSAQAEPMLPPTDEEFCNANAIVEAAYLSYRPKSGDEKISYFQVPIARYRVLNLRHGALPPKVFEVRYEFQDGSACTEPKDWKFSESLMPKVGSVRLLFLQVTPDGIYNTVRGDTGRLEVGIGTSELLERCQKLWVKTPEAGKK